MSPIRNQLVRVIDTLDEPEQILLFEIARRFISDDIATPEDIAVHEAAVAEYKRGETVPHDDVDWN